MFIRMMGMNVVLLSRGEKLAVWTLIVMTTVALMIMTVWIGIDSALLVCDVKKREIKINKAFELSLVDQRIIFIVILTLIIVTVFVQPERLTFHTEELITENSNIFSSIRLFIILKIFEYFSSENHSKAIQILLWFLREFCFVLNLLKESTMSRSGLRGRRTRLYDANYNISQNYYKSALDDLDRKYSGK